MKAKILFGHVNSVHHKLECRSSKTNATRHYSLKHQKDLKKFKPNVQPPTIKIFEVNPELIAKRQTTQEKFDSNILKLLTIQGLPFDTVEKLEFKNLITCLNPHVHLFSKSTYTSRIDSLIEKEVFELL